MASFFHAYDLRGEYPDEIGEKEAERVGKAFGTHLDSEEVLIGRDGRNHGEDVEDAFVEGVLSTGTDIAHAGMVPTPLIYFGTIHLDLGASAAVTASHNPPEYTGFKFCRENGVAMSREGGMAEIEEIYESQEFDEGSGERRELDLAEKYIEFVSEKIEIEEGLELVCNFGNGVAGEIGREVLEEIGCEVEGINEEVDGDFPNHLPAPGEEEAQKLVAERIDDKDLGVIFDGDGDRAGFVLPELGYIGEDEVLAIYSEEILKRSDMDNPKVVHDLRASKLVPEKIKESGGEAVETRVGHTFISEKIHDDDGIVFAGELSGHYYFPLLGVQWDDGIFSAALMSEILSKTDLEDSLKDFPDYPVSPELRITCPEKAKKRVVEAVTSTYSGHETSTLDGVKIKFETGWALVRPSNTEEKMSVRCEADTEEDLDRILNEVENTVREFIEKYG